MDGDDDESSSEDEDNGNSRESKEKEGRKVSNAKNRGKLVQDILADEQKKDGEKKSKKDKKKDKKKKEKEEKGIKLSRRLGGKSANRHVDVNIDSLRNAVQKICQSTNPLSKCMDFVNND